MRIVRFVARLDLTALACQKRRVPALLRCLNFLSVLTREVHPPAASAKGGANILMAFALDWV